IDQTRGNVIVDEGGSMTIDCAYASEGDNVTLSCNYSGSVNNLQWYRQYPRSAPEFLLLIMESSGSVPYPKPRMSPKVDKENKRVDLELSSTEVTDSAVYYCALRPTVTGNSLTLYKNLTASQEQTWGASAGREEGREKRGPVEEGLQETGEWERTAMKSPGAAAGGQSQNV
uniref:T-cell receptor alpha/delta variable 14.0 n=1 Tax=Paramormyrops kingsleyae TaxID=1676925 RepID=A0A3B3Q3S3_9TELE